MAYGDRTQQDVLDLETAIEEYEEENGNNEFTEGVLAVIKYLMGDEMADTQAFMKEYGLTGE